MNPVSVFEYNQYGRPRTTHTVKVLEEPDDVIAKLVIDTGDKQVEIMGIDRDQWGVWLTIGGHTVAQEDGTRSFLDALIKSLQYVRETYEWKCPDATQIACIPVSDSDEST